MRLTSFSLGLISFSGFLTVGLFSINSANAQCLQADVSVQYNISGSKQPTDRSNDVVMQNEEGCSGNVSVTRGVQGNVGGNTPVQQHRRVHHRQQNSNRNSTGTNNSTVQIRSNVGIDVYNPADNFER